MNAGGSAGQEGLCGNISNWNENPGTVRGKKRKVLFETCPGLDPGAGQLLWQVCVQVKKAEGGWRGESPLCTGGGRMGGRIVLPWKHGETLGKTGV